MHFYTKAALGSLTCYLMATIALASPPMLEEPHFAPGPMHVAAVPHYYDPQHTEHDYRYWQSIHDEQVQAQQTREHDLAVRRAAADRAIAEEHLQEMQAQQAAQNPNYTQPPVTYAPATR